MAKTETKVTITKSRAGHYWLRVRSLAMPDIFVGDAFSTKQEAQQAIPEYVESCLAGVRIETLRLNINAS